MGGIGMSGIARMYLAMGYRVQGSDLKKNDILCQLERLGAKIIVGHDADSIRGADVVVYSSAIGEDHPERREALSKGTRVIHRSEALAEICEGKFTIAVSGTHGKTTTTALVGMILKEADRNPSIVVGGTVNFFGGNACYGTGREIVIEADESDSSFLNFRPDIEVITNIEREHVDHFQNMHAIESAYRRFIGLLPKDGVWFGCAEDSVVSRMAETEIKNAVLYGFSKKTSRYWASDIIECPKHRRGVDFTVWDGDVRLGTVEMKIIGRHNVLNALAAIGVGVQLGISFSTIALALSKYEGAGRRFDVKYEDDDFLIVDDYAHHPTEIQKTLLAATALKRKRIVALFQPHRYTRTEAFLNEFGRSFEKADKLIVTDIYAASEKPRPGVSGQTVCESVKKTGHPDVTFVDRSRVTEYLQKEVCSGDLVIALGAGDISRVTDEISQILKQDLFKNIRGKVLTGEPLSKHTSLKVGGPAEFWIEPLDLQDLKTVLELSRKNGFSFFIFGAGSNILAPDEGVKGVVAHLNAPYFREIFEKDGKVIARAGVPNSIFIQFALLHGYGDFEFLVGIPASIGGSIMMNAGSHGQSIDSLIESVTVMSPGGETCVMKREDTHFGYRHSGLVGVVVEASFKLPKKSRPVVEKKLAEYHLYRSQTQDLQHASAGCMFKNPKGSGCSSGKLIEDAGLKGKRVGNAQVSTKHANFIINLGGATSQDILNLISQTQQGVEKKFGVKLETEVKIL